MDHRNLRFGPFLLDCQAKRLWRDSREIPLMPKALDVLVYLGEHAGQVVSREEMLDALWPGTYVDDHALSVQIGEIRRALGDDVRKPCYVATRHRRGYVFVAKLETQAEEFRAPESGPGPEPGPRTHYACTEQVNIAYQVVGEGPIDVVFIMGWISHLEYFWREPRFALFLKRLSSISRLILLDKRGTGLSDRVPLQDLPTLEQRMDDLRTVMDAAGCRQAAIIGVSEGGPLASVFAATYPERTFALIMIGTYARRMRDADYPWGLTVEQREKFLQEIQDGWGGPVGIEVRAPSLAQDPEFRDWWATYLRMGASPGAAQTLTRMNAEIDVRGVLPLVRVPALVIHRSGDRCFHVDEGRFVASLIPGAKFVDLPGEDHLPFVGNVEEMIGEIESFLLSVSRSAEPNRVLATVLAFEFRAEATPFDREAWDQLSPEIRREVKWHRGVVAGSSENGLLTTFDGPTRAIRCAMAVLERATHRRSGLRAGLHVGECEHPEGPDASGPAVTVALRLLRLAADGEILATSTLRDLAAGPGILFEDRGPLPKTESEREWRLLRIPVRLTQVSESHHA